MRINPYIQVQQLYNTKSVNKAGKTSSVARTDALEISNIGKEIQTAKAAVANSSDIREDVTAPIKRAIEKGEYDVSADSFAEKLLNAYQGI